MALPKSEKWALKRLHKALQNDAERHGLIRAIIDNPANMRQFADTAEAEDIFSHVINAIPDDYEKLFQIVINAKGGWCLRMLFSHAAANQQTDRIISYIIRKFNKVCRLNYFPNELYRMLDNAPAAETINLIRATNPRKRSRMADDLDLSVLWEKAIAKLLSEKKYRFAYQEMLQAGQGFPVERDAPLTLFPRNGDRLFITQIKDWHQSDDAFWQTYGRVPDLKPLIEMVFQAHVKAEIIEKLAVGDFQGQSRIKVQVVRELSEGRSLILNTHQFTPCSGLIARHAVRKSLKTYKRSGMAGMRFLSAPNIQGAQLTETGAMLQKLIIHYQDKYIVHERK
ncbi:MAG: hypothetical protein ACOYUZ_04670 [Patescibacteria group bacterium]